MSRRLDIRQELRKLQQENELLRRRLAAKNHQVDELLGQLVEIVECCKAHGFTLKWIDDDASSEAKA